MTKSNATFAKLAVSRRLRSTPYTPRIEALGVTDYSIVNHTVLPKGFGKTVDEDYWHLREHVQLWDVSCQRQVEIKGRDAAQLVQLMTPRDLRSAKVGRCYYAPLIDDKAGMLNDPIILVIAEDHFWLSIADSDVLLWAKGLAVGMSLDVEIDEPDVSPLAVQGPKSDELLSRVFGDVVRSIGFFRFLKLDFQGHPLVVARSGYSKQGGFEIYLDDSSLGLPLWDALWDAGHDLNVWPGSPNLIERIEGGLMSYGNEFTRQNNPLECGLEQYCSLDGAVESIGREALLSIKRKGPERLIRGICFSGERCSPCASTWPLLADGSDQQAGYITSAIWSPRFECNIAMAMLNREYLSVGQKVQVQLPDSIESGFVVGLPFDDSLKQIESGKSGWPKN